MTKALLAISVISFPIGRGRTAARSKRDATRERSCSVCWEPTDPTGAILTVGTSLVAISAEAIQVSLMDEESFIKAYKELTGATETAARAVYMYACPDRREGDESPAANGALAFPQAKSSSLPEQITTVRPQTNSLIQPRATEIRQSLPAATGA
jgi:hypothetical protein